MTEDRPPPIPRSPNLRKRLFVPALSRLLSDPAELALDDSADSIRIRLSEAIRLVEKRCEALTAATARTRRFAGLLLGVCLVSAVIAGAMAFLASEGLAVYLGVAGVSVAIGFLLAVAASVRTADLASLALVRTRYRPLLDGSETVSELRELAERIGSEMARITIDPGRARR